MNIRYLAVFLGLAVTTVAATAQQLRIDVTTVDGMHESHLFALGSEQSWDTTTEHRFSPTEGDCSHFETSKIKSGTRVGRLIQVQGQPFGADQAVVWFAYDNVKLLKINLFHETPACGINLAETHRDTYGSELILRKGESQTVGSILNGSETLSITLVD